jgi:hypothetical protein
VGAGLDIVLALADRRAVTPTGSVPKALSRSELVVECQATGCGAVFSSIRGLDTDVVLVTPHWGPNMVA